MIHSDYVAAVIFVFILVIYNTLQEGFQHRDRIEPDGSISRAWHIFGLIIRFSGFAILMLLVKQEPQWIKIFLGTAYAIMAWPLYNISCAIGGKQKWYSLSDKGIDLALKTIKRFLINRWAWIARQYKKEV